MSTENGQRFTAGQRDTLLALAADSIRAGLDGGSRPGIDAGDWPAWLREPAACFVTLESAGRLRGCIGSLQPHAMLGEDVVHNAWSAAFRDPRFPPLEVAELDALDLHISILGRPEPLTFDSEAGLTGQLRPGIDGLILREGAASGTFLPSVWESLPEPENFLRHLKVKAGLAADYWSGAIRAERYTTESFGAAWREIDLAASAE